LPQAFNGLSDRLTSLDDALASCEIAIVLVDHDEFKGIPIFARRHMTVLDTRGIWRDMSSVGTVFDFTSTYPKRELSSTGRPAFPYGLSPDNGSNGKELSQANTEGSAANVA
jgi:hypothetical protein